MGKELKRILFIDDDKNIRQLSELALRQSGIPDVITCRTYIDAMDVMKKARPDLILLDVMMPDIDGIEALSEIRKKETLKNIPVIFVTAKVKPHEVGHYIHLGAIGVIPKPFDPTKLYRQIIELWEEYRYRDETTYG